MSDNAPAGAKPRFSAGTLPMLRRRTCDYFHSGWAFLVPYQAAYLLYGWRGWPANPGGVAAAHSAVPPLLHLYWALHLGHGLLLAWAVWPMLARADALRSKLRWGIPWLLLSLLFAVPGMYLEWPADSWEHLRRITEWQSHATVGDHSAGYKSLYFFAYTCLAIWPSAQVLRAADCYYVGVCLALAWQYYHLARALGFGRRWALAAVAAAALMFGNASFSFFRYYGLASTMFAQIGAVAAIRIAVQVLRPPDPAAGRATDSIGRRVRRYLAAVIGGALLTVVVASNHRQGIGIAAFGICGVLVWSIHHRWRRFTWWLAAGAIALNVIALCLWTGGWNAYYSGVTSPEFVHGVSQVIGVAGWFTLAVAVYLMCRGDACGFLTVVPLVVLAMPAGFLPLAGIVARNGASITYARMLFAIPAGFALLAALQRARRDGAIRRGFVAPIAALVLLTIAGPAGPQFNRSWNALAVVPVDLRFAALEASTSQLRERSDARPVATDAVAAVYQSLAGVPFENRYRAIGQPITPSVAHTIGAAASWGPTSADTPTLTGDPAMTTPSAWSTLAGSRPSFVPALSPDAPARLALANPVGATSEVFAAELIRIDPRRSYRVEMSAVSGDGLGAPVFLAVAWYDAAGHLLAANAPAPQGAGHPAGWRNGTYSYFGLVGQSPPRRWTTYRQSFGPGEAAAIPSQAAFVRPGVLLNYPGLSTATAQVTNIRLWAKSIGELMSDGHAAPGEARLIVSPDWRALVSPISAAGLASGHWPRSQLAADHAGVAEVRRAAADSGGELLGAFPWLYLIRPRPQRVPEHSAPPSTS